MEIKFRGKGILEVFIYFILAGLIIAASGFLSCKDSVTARVKQVLARCNCSYIIVISKKDFSLKVYNRKADVEAEYRIGYASNPDMLAKLYEGDNRTPEGEYLVNEILSMDSERYTESYLKLKAMNGVYFPASKGYHKYGRPETDLGDNAYGPRYYGINYPNDKDMERYRDALNKGKIPEINGKRAGIGYGIAIHGNNDEESIGHLCSSGCIRMYNRDIVELEKYISISTPVIIKD